MTATSGIMSDSASKHDAWQRYIPEDKARSDSKGKGKVDVKGKSKGKGKEFWSSPRPQPHRSQPLARERVARRSGKISVVLHFGARWSVALFRSNAVQVVP